MKSSLYWAMTHPCYDPWSRTYICRCGHHSSSVRAHDKHVFCEHGDNEKEVEELVSWKSFEKFKKTKK